MPPDQRFVKTEHGWTVVNRTDATPEQLRKLSEFLPAPPLEQQRTYRGNPLPLPSHAHTAAALAASHSRAQYAALQALHAHAEVTAAGAATPTADDWLHGDLGLAHDPLIGNWHDLADPTRRRWRQARQQEAIRHVRECAQQLDRVVLPHSQPVEASLDGNPSGFSTLCTQSVAAAFFAAADEHGITLYEPFGGLCAGLEMCMRAGIRVARYLYSDTDTAARRVAAARINEMLRAHPDLFPPEAVRDTFDALPQDVLQVDRDTLIAAGACGSGAGEQWAVVAGFECADLSPAGGGLGLGGARSGATFHALVRILGTLQQLQQHRPPAYLVENAALQYNFNHELPLSQTSRLLVDVLMVSKRVTASLVERSFASDADLTQVGTRPNWPRANSSTSGLVGAASAGACDSGAVEATAALRMNKPCCRGQTSLPGSFSGGTRPKASAYRSALFRHSYWVLMRGMLTDLIPSRPC